jgi:hypothetical protein
MARPISAQGWKPLLERIEAFFPKAKTPHVATDLTSWEAAYNQDPAGAYRRATPPVRAALDHRLWADATQRSFEVQAEANPKGALALGDEAAQRLPDRPAVATSLWTRGLQEAARDIGTLRRSEVDQIAKIYRDKLHQPEQAREVYRLWLDDQRQHRLSPTDAEGRVALASQYETLVGDKNTAISLLRSAWTIDPQSKETAEAFRQRGYRNVGDEWLAPVPQTVARNEDSAPSRPAIAAPVPSDTLLRCTPRQVRERLGGKPTRTVWVASQGQLIEQWIYVGAKQSQYVNFLHRPGDPRPKVVAYYSLPHRPGSGQ